VRNCLILTVFFSFFADIFILCQTHVLSFFTNFGSVAISLILFILGIGICISSIYDFKLGEAAIPDFSEEVLIVVSLLFTFIFFALTVVKLQMSIVLDSRALLKDGYCSLFGTILALSLFLNTIIVKGIHQLWWLDPLISLIVGAASLFLGLRSVMIQTCEKGVPIWNPKWWLMSQGNVTLEDATKIDEEMQKQQPGQTSTSPPILYDDLDLNKEQNTTDVSLNQEVKETEMTTIENKNGGDNVPQPTHTID